MSWRILLFTLLVLAGIATAGGLYTGDWLIAHAPKQANLPNINENDPAPPVDANGVPLMRQPPQLLMSGRIGLPEAMPEIDWHIKAENLSEDKTDSIPFILDSVINADSASRVVNTRPIGQTIQPAPNNNVSGWQADFQREMAACRQLGFFDRARCVGETREHYCGANKAWGRVDDCPAR
ncbi:hypothetical protein [Pelistega europaea]|uniref:Uncharacterized protein n=1 Tax=Pelistega europaea TaxID=106147 RepID=A0A7Y4P595_9BURK|nr:hypothetical protein [Pelistega europaea]NOL48629.1 hypothetical protein [Pelistega europaea]